MVFRYVTTPIYYVNDRPHMGHAYASVHADVVARYLRAAGYQVMFVTGADEHGEKIARAASAAADTPQAFTDRHAGAFQQAWQQLEVKPDHFVRTSASAHKEVVVHCLTRLHDAGDIYLTDYEGRYSVGQERFVTEKELIDGKLPEDRDPPVLRRESNYFFRMEKYRDPIRRLLNDFPELINPPQYRNEVLRLLDEPIGDLSISRPRARLDWGIPLPWDPEQVTYVWFDALLSYVSALQFPDSQMFRDFWPTARHVIGKDILRPHTLFWLAILQALGIPPYQRLHVSGHLLGNDRRKMSKSLGNGVDPLEAATLYGADALRYALVREVAFGVDGVISHAAIEHRLNRDLADDFGNLVSRSLAMIVRYREGRVPAPGPYTSLEEEISRRACALPGEVLILVDDLKLAQALEHIFEYVRHLNGYIAITAPWELARADSDPARLNTVLNTLAEGISAASDLLAPVLPVSTGRLREVLGRAKTDRWAVPWGQGVAVGHIVRKIVLFPKRSSVVT
ncbi:methionine--tRNA ligase [Paraburkholderia terrae]|uniref:Methionine--tRNA ligase n=1 Tax=Paraburkholderia terrae TaxID=311230 RepID=A0ABN6JX58_9BURK|nr:methionine--tRNA ligase [Paraburkholderia terrae]BCZ85194.1 methionine--tRNA ligase [Paraburkholderia terrae]BCZ85289.1 methionine--tRNA ligase [Paraburkholderia terrae]